MKHHLRQPKRARELEEVFKATGMCLRDNIPLIERSLVDPDTRWYANMSTGYVRFVRRRIEIDGDRDEAWLLDVSYTKHGLFKMHKSSVQYMLEASKLLAAEEPVALQLLAKDRRLATLLRTHSDTPVETIEAKILGHPTQPICKYRHDCSHAVEFSRKEYTSAEAQFHVLYRALIGYQSTVNKRESCTSKRPVLAPASNHPWA